MKTRRGVIGFLASLVIVLAAQGCGGQAGVIPVSAPGSSGDTAGASLQAAVQSVDVLKVNADPADIRIIAQAVLPNGCYRLDEAAVSRDGRVFTVTIPAHAVSNQGCGAVPLALRQDVRLPADGLTPGSYVVLVNGFLATFNIAAPAVSSASSAAKPGSGGVVAVGTGAGVDAPVVQPKATVIAGSAATAATESPAQADQPAANPVTPTAAAPTATATAVPTLAPTATLPPPTPTVTPTAPPLALGGTDPGQCVNKAALWGDVNLPPGTPVEAGAAFTKSWMIRNVGTCVWGQGYQLVFAGGDQLGAPDKIPLQAARPGTVIQVSVPMTAPVPVKGYVGRWAIQSPEGYVFGMGYPSVVPLEVKISVLARPVDVPSNLNCGALRDRAMEQAVLDEINATRAQYNLPPYALADDLSYVALGHSLEMACYNRESHRGLDGQLYNVRIQRQGILYATSNEIIYSGNGGPKGALDWWMHSKIHKPIVLSDKYTLVGVGYVFYDGNPYKQRITIDFIHP